MFGDEEVSAKQKWLEVSKRVFDGDREHKINRYKKAENQRSWFWRNLPQKLDPSLQEHDRNFPMMFRAATKDQLSQMESKWYNSRQQFANYTKSQLLDTAMPRNKRADQAKRRFSADGMKSIVRRQTKNAEKKQLEKMQFYEQQT